MSNKDVIKTYQEYANKIGNRKEIYKIVVDTFPIKRALYPGSHIDIAPSLIIPDMTYVDNFKGAIQFFKHLEVINAYINKNKSYKENSEIKFLGQDYKEDLLIEPVDFIISQYAGFVGQATKKYLKTGGILLCNDSHGDATLAKEDADFEFIGVIDQHNQLNQENLDQYFTFTKNKIVDIEMVLNKMQGPKYQKRTENYLFRKK